MTIPAFNNHLPVGLRFGDGRAHEIFPLLGEEIAAKHPLLLVDEGLADHNPGVAELVGAFQAGFDELLLVAKPAGEPTIGMVEDVLDAASTKPVDAIVAIGGGSVMDTAKAARLCLQTGSSFRAFLDSARLFPAPTLPLIAVPTTAGTGSEVSGGAVFSDPELGTKAGIAHPNLRAQYAFVDPLLTLTMPAGMTAHTGVDALAQAIAAIIAKVSTPIGDAIALEAIRMISGSLVQAYREGSNLEARRLMACAATMAGIAMNISDCTAEHSLGQAIGGLTNAPHGLTVGLVLVETLERERAHVPTALERVADAMEIPQDGSGDGRRAVEAIRSILSDLDFPVLSSLGITEHDVDRLTAAACNDYFITQAPAPWDRSEVQRAFKAALAVKER